MVLYRSSGYIKHKCVESSVRFGKSSRVAADIHRKWRNVVTVGIVRSKGVSSSISLPAVSLKAGVVRAIITLGPYSLIIIWFIPSKLLVKPSLLFCECITSAHVFSNIVNDLEILSRYLVDQRRGHLHPQATNPGSPPPGPRS